MRELVSLIENDKDCSAILRNYNANAQTLRELFRELEKASADEWSKNQYIPCLALAEPWTLESPASPNANGKGGWKTGALRVVAFYQGEPLTPPPFDHDGEPSVESPDSFLT